MEIAKIHVTGTYARIVSRKPIPEGLIGGYITVEYRDPVWQDLTKTVVFKGAVTRDVVTEDRTVTIPAETIAAGKRMLVGFYGTRAEGILAIPTFWADLGAVMAATDPSGDEYTDPSLPVWAQLTQRVEDLEKNGGGSGGNVDLTGVVKSVNGQTPDENGNVPLTAANIGALPNTGGDLTGELRMNGQPISGLNAPMANDQAANMGFVNQQVRKAAPRNLLDNSDFRNPVNQRGQQSYTNQYCIDRWIANSYGGNGTIAINTGYITLTPTSGNYVEINQILDNADKLTGKAITLAIKTAEYGTSIYNFTFGIGGQAVDREITLIHYGGNTVIIRVTTTINLEWAALYEGEYTLETLPEYQPKGYGAELAECRRYFRPSVVYNMVCHYDGYLIGAHLEVPMRINPTISVTSTHTGKWEEVSGTTAANSGDGGISTVENTNFTVGNWYRVGLELNADL